MIEWRHKSRELTERLGVHDPKWHGAFQNTPRHIFVPRFYRDDMTLLDSAEPQYRREWMAAVYGDNSLTIQYAHVPGTDLMWPTSSSTKPSLMAHMFDLLDVHDGHRVLEIGTGTGYNTALLCHRLGDTNVASIDIDPDLVATARTRLATLGQHPTLVSGDGVQGIPDAAPFDRIIATCAVATIPSPWIGQLHDGGIVVTDLRGEIASNLIVLRKIDERTVQGRYQSAPGHFMWLRPRVDHPLRDDDELITTIDRDDASWRFTQLDPSALDHPDLRFFLQLREPTIQSLWHMTRDATELLCVHAIDGAWAEAETTSKHGHHSVTQGGPRHIWDQIEHVAALWTQLGQPRADRFGLTAEHQRLWLDTPESGYTWPS